MRVDPDDAIELVELLELIGDWVTSCDTTAAWERFVGAPYGCDDLQRDPLRFVVFLGGPVTDSRSDGPVER